MKIKALYIWATFILISAISISAITDNNLSNNNANISINIVETKVMPTLFVRIANSQNDNLNNNFENFSKNMSFFLNKVYPVRDNNPIFYNDSSSPLYFSDSNYENRPISFLGEVERRIRVSNQNFSRIVGVISNNFANNFLRYPDAYTDFGHTMVIVPEKENPEDYKEATAAHEIGHTYWLCDETSKEEYSRQANRSINLTCPNGDKNYDKMLDEECINTSGFPINGCPLRENDLIKELFYPNNTLLYAHNLYNTKLSLSLPHRRWINNNTYSHLLSEFSQSGGNILCTNEKLVVISGEIDQEYNTELDNFYLLNGGCYTNYTLDTGPFFINVLVKRFGDLTGLYSYPIPFIGLGDSNNSIGSNISSFVLTVPFENATSFEIQNQSNNISLSFRNVSENSPEVNITSELADKILVTPFNISWESYDLDGDNISFAVLLSTDGGGIYNTLILDLNETYFELDPRNHPFSENTMVKVLATDSVNTGYNMTENFTLGNPISAANLNYLSENPHNLEYILQNRHSESLEVNWSLDLDDGTFINNTSPINLSGGQRMFVYVEHNYTQNGNYTITGNVSSGNLSDEISLNISIGTKLLNVTGLKTLYSLDTYRIFEFFIGNNHNETLSDINWSLDTGESIITSTTNITLVPNESIRVLVGHNYTTDANYDITASAYSSNGNRHQTISVDILEVTNFTVVNGSVGSYVLPTQYVVFYGEIKNNDAQQMSNINWSLDFGDGSAANGTSTITLGSNESVFVYVEHPYDPPSTDPYNPTVYQPNFTARSGNYNDTQDSQLSRYQLAI